jgi:SMODS-associated and fused to various effectors sensor domain
MTDDVQKFLQEKHVPASRLIVLGPPGGPRDNAIAGPEQACALAVGLRDATRRAAHGHQRVRLFLAAPMCLALLLGHRWNRVAPTTVYEDLAAQGYEAAFTVSA